MDEMFRVLIRACAMQVLPVVRGRKGQDRRQTMLHVVGMEWDQVVRWWWYIYIYNIYIIIYGGVLNWRYPQIIYVIFGFFIIHLTKNKINHPAHGAAPWLWTPPEPGHHDFVPTQMLRILQLKPIENQNTADLDKEFFQWRWHAMAMEMGQVTCEVTRND
jgi:hypothetical protein